MPHSPFRPGVVGNSYNYKVCANTLLQTLQAISKKSQPWEVAYDCNETKYSMTSHDVHFLAVNPFSVIPIKPQIAFLVHRFVCVLLSATSMDMHDKTRANYRDNINLKRIPAQHAPLPRWAARNDNNNTNLKNTTTSTTTQPEHVKSHHKKQKSRDKQASSPEG